MPIRLIKEIHAWVGIAENGDEGLLSARISTPGKPARMTYLMADSRKVALSMEHIALDVMGGTQMARLELRKFVEVPEATTEFATNTVVGLKPLPPTTIQRRRKIN